MKASRSTSALLLGVGLSWGCSQGQDGLPSGSPSGGGSLVGDGDGDGDAKGGSGDGDGVATGGNGTAGTPPLSEDVTCSEVGDNAGPSVLRRLSKVEYQLTLQDLFELEEPPSVDLVPEDALHEGFSTFSDLQSVTAAHLRGYWDTVTPLAADLASVEAAMCSGGAGCLRTFAARFGRLAFRRSLSDSELDVWTAKAEDNGLDATDRFAYLIESLLIAPEFLFRIEVGDQKEGLSTLSALEVASKLSFSLWGRSPSAELLDRAEQGELSSDQGIAAVAAEMLESPKARYFYEQFFRQWLGYGKLRAPVDPPDDWSDDLMPQMTQETDALAAEFAWSPQTHFLDLLTTNHTTLSRGLASFYGDTLPAAPGGGAARIEHAADDPRAHAGVLGHAAILSQKKDGDKVSVRGNWLRRTFLCQELEIPAEVAAVLGEQLVGLTSMQIIEHRNQEPACRKCHSAIDPIGVGLAQFDATGRFDETINLDSYPILPGFPDAEDPSFSSLGELAQKLRSMPEVSACLAERVFVYAEGRHPEPEDVCSSEAASRGFADGGGSFSALVRHLVTSRGFRLRRAPSPTL